MKIARRLSLLLLTAMTMLYATPAAAVPDPDKYVWMDCAPGEPAITGQLTAVTDGYRVVGTITGCHPNTGDEAYAVAQYSSNGAAFGLASPYLPSGVVYYEIMPSPYLAAVCLLINPWTRLDCIDPATGAHIPVNSPMVSVAATIDMRKHGGVGPNCPSCFD